MSDELQPSRPADEHGVQRDVTELGESPDPGADTGAFQAFQDGVGEHRPTSTAFRLWTLAGGLVAFVLLVWLLLV